jgi:biotin carboxylase
MRIDTPTAPAPARRPARTSGEQRTLLIVSGGSEALAGIRTARALGLHVLVSDGDPAAPGLAAAHEGLLASTYDVAATVTAARRYHRHTRPIDGVICIASDVPLTVASVAQELGLPGVSLATARLSGDKLAMKQCLAEQHVPIPAFAATPTAKDLEAYVARNGYPVVVKPVDSRGARGVLLLTDARTAGDLAWAHATALRESPSGRVMVERFLDGPQLSTESLVVEGVCHTIGLADRNYRDLRRFAPYVIEDGGELPSSLDAQARAAVCDVAQRAADALGVHSGVLKGDIVMHAGRPHVIEVAVRLSGGYLCTHEIPLSTGVDFVAQAIRLALGDDPGTDDMRPMRRTGVAQRWLFPAPGRVARVAGVREVAARPEVALCEVRVGVGDEVPPLSSHRSRAGVVIATGATRGEAVAQAERAVADITIETRGG